MKYASRREGYSGNIKRQETGSDQVLDSWGKPGSICCQPMASVIKKRSIKVEGHNTSVSLEDEFWSALKEIATAGGTTMHALVAQVHEKRIGNNLSSALRVYVLEHYREQATSIALEKISTR